MNSFWTVTPHTPSVATMRTAAGYLLILAFTLLTAIGAQISIPAIPVPFTLQTFFVLLSGAVLGARRGAASQLLYLAAGAAGAPVFAGFKASFLHLVGPTGGYLLAFPVAAFLTGYVLHNLPVTKRLPVFPAAVAGMTLAMLVIFLAGVTQLNLVVFHNWNAAMTAGFLNLQIWDGAKIIAAATLAASIGKRFAH